MKRIIQLLVVSYWLLVSPAAVLAASLSLSPASGTFNKGCNFSLQIVLDTGSAQTDGTDAIVTYDQSKFSATSISSGSIYPDYPGNNIDDTTGKLTVSGLASVSSPFTGKGTLATVNFTVKENAGPGVSQMKFDFNANDKTNTTDSNVVERGTVADVLSSVVNGNYTIGSGTTCAAATTSTTPKPGVNTSTASGAVTAPTIDDIVGKGEDTGATELTFTLAIIGSILTILGILGLALL
ncbi:hypothetical protein A3C59_03290 [Candidatus Daviesbacteria bacterium RIFCSPHIGHO2_02_FULL_36_13]|uniref:Cohesin domain-containing protein n=1 Tax=Candidatus Daviesbacteria bacterium RIFCSPHIGHO2_02_FULL_36_13 TaxID=1797768 RepID=A0A1F5JPW5_9BACT|nr:MAG: hypothetical protein A3C59_03290 [Candidatus Daviesbacteria bacterium RIFCSPHIGHO2_02_FULL_36_13]OGE42811.1 MAG: hypothetical protein A3A45_03520 [Candidatus Daviesbacteria bacterium RIFCSPLOWO2_01_FULL_36_8]